METTGGNTPEEQIEQTSAWGEGAYPEEGVERQLAHYAFVREERDREVRLLFRDAPAPEIAATFRAAGATLISIAGEWVPRGGDALLAAHDKQRGYAARGSKRAAATPPPSGELTLRYFFALEETVYTVSITSASGIASSVAGVYPGASPSEREIQSRLGVLFT